MGRRLGGPWPCSSGEPTDAKRATEARIRSVAFESVIIRPDALQEFWLSPAVGFDPIHPTARIFGKGTARTRFVGVEDVAEAIARIAVADTPPGEVILGGPEALYSGFRALGITPRPVSGCLRTLAGQAAG